MGRSGYYQYCPAQVPTTSRSQLNSFFPLSEAACATQVLFFFPTLLSIFRPSRRRAGPVQQMYYRAYSSNVYMACLVYAYTYMYLGDKVFSTLAFSGDSKFGWPLSAAFNMIVVNKAATVIRRRGACYSRREAASPRISAIAVQYVLWPGTFTSWLIRRPTIRALQYQDTVILSDPANCNKWTPVPVVMGIHIVSIPNSMRKNAEFRRFPHFQC